MTGTQLRGLLSEARELGVPIVLFAGVFPMFTNGLLIDETVARRLGAQKNVLPVLSLEGHEGDTDGRRGSPARSPRTPTRTSGTCR